MPKALNQNQVLNYLADLPSLLDQARPYLDLRNRQGKEIDFKEIDQLLRVYALNLTLLSLEEFKNLPFEKVFERLEWLFEQEKLIEGGKVPLNLKELEAQLQEKEEKTTKETKQRREVENLVADLEKRAKLLAALKKAQIKTKIEAPPDWEAIIRSLPENEELANDIQKTVTNPELPRWEKEELAQENWERFLKQSLPDATLGEIKNPLSLESLELVAGQIKKSPEEREILVEHLTKISRPLTPEQAASLKESLIANLVALSPLARDLGWEGAAKSAAWQIKDQFKELPLEQIYLFARQFAPEAERIVPAESLSTEASIFSPLVIKIGEEMSPFAAAQEIPGNPSGNAWLVKDKDNQPFPYHLTIRGVSPKELEELEKIQQMVSGDPRSPSSQFLSQWAIKLREFQTRYFSQEAIIWQANRVKAIFNTSQVLTPLSKIFQQAKDWFFQTSAGQTVELWLAKASQKSLEALFTTAKTGVKTAITEGVTVFLTKIGLHALAKLAPIIGEVIAFLGEKVIKEGFSLVKRAGGFLLSGFGLANVVMEGIAGQREIKDTSGTGWLATAGVASAIGLVAVLSLFTIMNKQKGLLGRGAGGPLSTPGLPVAKPPECQAPRHLAEEVICLLTHTPCSFPQDRINWGTRGLIGPCLDNLSIQGEALAGLKYVLQNYHCYYSNETCPPSCLPEECPLQCLQFVIAITNALGQSINLDYDHAGAYADSYPSTYKKVSDPKLGDVVVWRGNPGHIGIFIAKVADSTKILVAEANFDLHGGVGLIERNGTSFDSGPSAYLRYCPSGNCQ